MNGQKIADIDVIGRYGWFMYGYWDHSSRKLPGMSLTVTKARIIFRVLFFLDRFEIATKDIEFAELLSRSMLWPLRVIRVHYKHANEDLKFTFFALRPAYVKNLLEQVGVKFRPTGTS
jgi:hypothetical protein